MIFGIICMMINIICIVTDILRMICTDKTAYVSFIFILYILFARFGFVYLLIVNLF